MSRPLAAYERRTGAGEIELDPAQRRAVEALERLHRDLAAAVPPRGALGPLSRLLDTASSGARGGRPLLRLRTLRTRPLRAPHPVRGVYLWGDVGRGKTFLMDLFYDCLPFPEKRRQHFHRFMGGIHERLKRLRERSDPLELVAAEIAEETRIICLDELAVNDIADAMILGRLFEALFAHGVTLTATSNMPPEDLYRDGLQRQRFLPAIALIEANLELVHVAGAHDYRLRLLERADVYQHPPGAEADRRLAEYFSAMAPEPGESDGRIEILGRELEYRRSADGIIWFDFPALCDGPRSQDDYIELSRCYHTVLLSGVPRFDRHLENQARRFIALVDEFYDRRVKLILSAQARLAELYGGRRLAREFQRTKSRLEEMQTHDYLAAPHKA